MKKQKKDYSIDGNYSSYSPEEKMEKRRKLEEKYKKYEEIAEKEYIQNLYYSKVRKDILERDNYRCQLCGKNGDSSLHVHHILKRRKGGKDYYDNLITCCPSCHKKADSSLYDPEWEMK